MGFSERTGRAASARAAGRRPRRPHRGARPRRPRRHARARLGRRGLARLGGRPPGIARRRHAAQHRRAPPGRRADPRAAAARRRARRARRRDGRARPRSSTPRSRWRRRRWLPPSRTPTGRRTGRPRGDGRSAGSSPTSPSTHATRASPNSTGSPPASPSSTCPRCCCGARATRSSATATSTTSSTGCRTPTCTASRAPATSSPRTALRGRGARMARRQRDRLTGRDTTSPRAPRPPRRTPPTTRRSCRSGTASTSAATTTTTADRRHVVRRSAGAAARELAAARRPGAAARGRAARDRRAQGRPRLAARPARADLSAVVYACLRIGAVVVVADAGLGIRGLTRAVRGAWPDFVIGEAPGLAAARALGWPGVRISAARLPRAAAAALGVSHSLGDIARDGRATHALPAPPGPDDDRRDPVHLGLDRPGQGRRLHARAALRAARRARRPVRRDRGTGLVAGFAPFALLGPALGARSVTPDMDVSSPRTLTATAVAAAVRESDARIVFLSPAAILNVVATADRAHRRRPRRARPACARSSPPARRSARGCSRPRELMPNATPHTPYGMTEGLLVTDVTLDGVRDAAGAPEAGVCVGTPIGVEPRARERARRRRPRDRRAERGRRASPARSSSRRRTSRTTTTGCGSPTAPPCARPTVGSRAAGDAGGTAPATSGTSTTAAGCGSRAGCRT